jgi:hypothetical protein
LYANYGWSVAAAGDVNADGFGDIIVGAPNYDSGAIDGGAAWVYLGGEAGVVDSPAWYKPSGQAGAQFGYSVASAGDVNGDGHSDVIVGAPFWTSDEAGEGAAWIYFGNDTDVNDPPDWYKQSDHAGAQFGFSVASAGDVNGDGYADVIVGAPYYQHINHPAEGVAAVYHGSAEVSTADWFRGPTDNAHFGSSVGTAGDVNRDGYSEVIVGSPMWESDAGDVNEGGAWVYQGSHDGLKSAPYWYAQPNQAGCLFGTVVGTAGDVNGDGYSDVLVEAEWSNTPLRRAPCGCIAMCNGFWNLIPPAHKPMQAPILATRRRPPGMSTAMAILMWSSGRATGAMGRTARARRSCTWAPQAG